MQLEPYNLKLKLHLPERKDLQELKIPVKNPKRNRLIRKTLEMDPAALLKITQKRIEMTRALQNTSKMIWKTQPDAKM